MKIISISMIIVLVSPLSARAEDRFLRTKTLGKLTMIAILSAVAFVVKMLVEKDRGEVARLHERLGLPDKIIEFQVVFDCWLVECYGNHVYIFRNGVLYRSLKSSETRNP
jgi:hypothetical protein